MVVLDERATVKCLPALLHPGTNDRNPPAACCRAGGDLVHDAVGAIIGAVGVSGDTGGNDEPVAIAGIEHTGLTAVPGEPSRPLN